MSRGYTTEDLILLHEGASKSVVQLVVYKKDNRQQCYFGTGVIVYHTSNFIGIITAISCNQGYQVFAKFDGMEPKAEVVESGKILTALLVRGHYVNTVPVTDALFEENIVQSEPLWAIGCFGDTLDQIMPPGLVNACSVEKNVRKVIVETFIHSCPIGDGLVGTPIINQFGKFLGITVARTDKISSLNHALKIAEITTELAELVSGEANYEDYNLQKSMSILFKKFNKVATKKGKMSGVGSCSGTAK